VGHVASMRQCEMYPEPWSRQLDDKQCLGLYGMKMVKWISEKRVCTGGHFIVLSG
jgi:hypothetical protein